MKQNLNELKLKGLIPTICLTEEQIKKATREVEETLNLYTIGFQPLFTNEEIRSPKEHREVINA